VEAFLAVHQEAIVGTLTQFDRVIFKGHLSRFYIGDTFRIFLAKQGVMLKDFGPYVAKTTEELKVAVKGIAEEAHRPYIYLDSAITKAKGQSKEEFASSMATKDGVTEGLICVLATLEACRSFGVRKNPQTHQLEVTGERRKCLHFYFYYLDAEFGLMHVRLQSWFPFSIQVYINGREWLGRQLELQGIGAQRYENCFLRIGDLAAAQGLCERFAHREWPRVLDAFAHRLNPKLSLIEGLGFGSYYWVIDQCEVATDIMFKDRDSLARLMPDLQNEAMVAFSCEDVMRFLGRKLYPNFRGEVRADLKKRPEGRRIKHYMAGNWIKMYDKFSVLRVETTLNNPREFKVLKQTDDSWRWLPMGKGVANIWRFYQVTSQANSRYIDALASLKTKGEAVRELDDLCRSHIKDGKRYAKFNPIAAPDCRLFAAALVGGHIINGFRNHDLVARLYEHEPPTNDPQEQKRRCARASRLIAKLRGHGLLAKVKDSRLYRVTQRGYQLMSAAVSFRLQSFPEALQAQALKAA
jgi:hypothetical protein